MPTTLTAAWSASAPRRCPVSDLSTLLAELDAKVAQMTKPPWCTFVRDIEQMSDGGKGYPLNVYPDCATVHVGHPTVDDERTGNVGLRRQEDIDGIVALVSAYPALREAIEQAIKTQQHMDETLRPLVEELRKDAHQARARETEACAEAARLRTERDEQAAIASNAVTKGAAYALENERLRALVAQQREECDEARARAIRWNNEHAAAEDRWVEERDALRAEVLQLRKNLLRTWAAAEVREYDLRKLVAQQREALQEMMVVYAGIGHGAGWDIAPANRALLIRAAEVARAVLAQEVPS